MDETKTRYNKCRSYKCLCGQLNVRGLLEDDGVCYRCGKDLEYLPYKLEDITLLIQDLSKQYKEKENG